MEYIILGIIIGAAIAYVFWYIRDKIGRLP